jgi:hypothetical protein
VVRVSDTEFDLELMPDMGSCRRAEWFCFSVSRSAAAHPARLRLNITNISNPECVHKLGAQPVVLSSARLDDGWVREGEELAFFKEDTSTSIAVAFTFSFVLRLEPGETKYVAHSCPYTASMLRSDIRLLQEVAPRECFHRETLSLTCAAVPCDVLTITAPETVDTIPISERPGVLVIARQHSGEVAGSWVCKGLLEFLLSRHYDAQFLRSHLVFKVIPMLNPDGVIQGMSRCSPEGFDLNRTWAEPDARLQPTVHAAKGLVARFCRERSVVMFVDLHGHSKRLGCHTYGCSDGDETLVTQCPGRILPRLMSLYCPHLFNLAECTYNVSSAKQSAARVVLWREFGVTNSYALESSMAGIGEGLLSNRHFSCSLYMEIGKALCSSAMDMWSGSSMRSNILSLIISKEGPSAVAQEEERGQPKAPKGEKAKTKKGSKSAPASRRLSRVKRGEHKSGSKQELESPEVVVQRDSWVVPQTALMPPIAPTPLRMACRTPLRRARPVQQSDDLVLRPLTVVGNCVIGNEMPRLHTAIQRQHPHQAPQCRYPPIAGSLLPPTSPSPPPPLLPPPPPANRTKKLA